MKSLLREAVKIHVAPAEKKLPDLVVTRNGVPCPDQQAALAEFVEACTPRPPTPQAEAERELLDDLHHRANLIEEASRWPIAAGQKEFLKDQAGKMRDALARYREAKGVPFASTSSKTPKSAKY